MATVAKANVPRFMTDDLVQIAANAPFCRIGACNGRARSSRAATVVPIGHTQKFISTKSRKVRSGRRAAVQISDRFKAAKAVAGLLESLP